MYIFFLSGWQQRGPVIEDAGINPKTPSGNKPAAALPTLSLPALLKLKIPQHVGAEYKTFGTFLLNDKTGTEVTSIEEELRGRTQRINMKILEEWLTGKGKPCTWHTLIETLRDCQLNALADQIEEATIRV